MRRPQVHRFRADYEVRTWLWLVPLLCVAFAVGLAIALLAIDRAAGHRIVGESVIGSPASAQAILQTSSTALVTLTSVVLTLTLVAVQLAMGQFSPRIVRSILHDRRSQLAIGMFVGTWAYTLTVLREVNGQSSGGGTAPGLPVLVNYALLLGAAVTLVLFVHHSAQSIRAGGLIGRVGDDTRKEIEQMYPAPDRGEEDPSVIAADRPGVLVKVHHTALVEIAEHADCVLELVPAMGDFVPLGAPVIRIEGELPKEASALAARCLILGRERTHEGDPAFGLRKLVDIAERSVYSSPWQDPGTSVQAINPIHDCLRRLAPREFPSGRHHDSAGKLRLLERTLDWEGYVRLAFDEIRLSGAGSPLVARRLRAALLDIKSVAPPERHPPLDAQLDLLTRAVERAYEDEEDRRAALEPDIVGIGSGRDVMSPPHRNGDSVNGASTAARARDRTPAPPRSTS
jgi:uncharacterized membrane protein